MKLRRFRDIKQALFFSHDNQADLYEEDDDGPNIVYSNRWDRPMRRAVWRATLSAYGMSPYNRNFMPAELKEGTVGPDFEVT